MVGDYDQLEAADGRATASRARSCSASTSPTGIPSFSAANDRTLAFAERSSGRLIPFVRLDLNESPIEEARRCLDAGARGIKLHPRAQKFDATDERLGPVFELAAERRVPILIHGGRGLPPIADGPARARRPLPGGDADHRPRRASPTWRASRAAWRGRKGVLFDTSTWSPVDLLDFYRQVPPEQVVYASDYPYGQQPSSLLIALKTARLAGYDDDQLRAMLGGTANALADGARAARADDAARRATRSRSRCSSRASTSTSRWRRRSSGRASRTRSACSGSRSTPAPSGTATPRRSTGSASCSRRRATSGRRCPRSRTRPSSAQRRGSTFRLIHLADIEAVTTLPELTVNGARYDVDAAGRHDARRGAARRARR